jgi:hypothetical protein
MPLTVSSPHSPGRCGSPAPKLVHARVGTDGARRPRTGSGGGRLPGRDDGVVAVEDHLPVLAEDARLGGRVGLQGAVPVQVILGHVEHHGRRGLEALHPVELKTRQLQHPDPRQCVGGEPIGQGVEQGRADIAGHGHVPADAAQQMAGERGGGGFAVGAGDGQHGRVVGPRLGEGAQGVSKQVQLAAHRHAHGGRGVAQRRQLRGGDARAARHQRPGRARKEIGVERDATQQRAARGHRLQRLGLRRLGARVGHGHARASRVQPARQRPPRGTEPQHEHIALAHTGQQVVGPDGRVHRSLRVDRPMRHNSMVMIQKRTTTCVSRQPDFSKW